MVKPFVSIIIPTKNADKWLDKLLPAIYEQDFKDFEIIIVDSGSTDDTEKKVKKIGAHFHKITHFGHGYARNYGASKARGEIVVFNNQDAVPIRRDWLRKLITPLLAEEDIVASFARPIPRADTHAAERYFILRTYPPESRIFSKSDLNKIDTRRTIIFSTISGAIKRKIWEIFKFNEQVIIGEDHELGLRLLRANLKIAYRSDALVLHSHNYTISDALRRYYDIGRNDKIIGERTNIKSEDLRYLMGLIEGTIHYVKSEGEGIKGILYALAYICAKIVGYLLGSWTG
jgi:rhamnosyltransferase